jgi:hypothetical protein
VLSTQGSHHCVVTWLGRHNWLCGRCTLLGPQHGACQQPRLFMCIVRWVGSLESAKQNTVGVQQTGCRLQLRQIHCCCPVVFWCCWSLMFALCCTVLHCRYYKPETKGLDFDGLMEDIKVCSCLGLQFP